MKFFVSVMITSSVLSLFGFFVAVREEIAVGLTSYEEIGMNIIYNGLCLYFAAFFIVIILGPFNTFTLQALLVMIIYEAFTMFAYFMYRKMSKQENTKEPII